MVIHNVLSVLKMSQKVLLILKHNFYIKNIF